MRGDRVDVRGKRRVVAGLFLGGETPARVYVNHVAGTEIRRGERVVDPPLERRGEALARRQVGHRRLAESPGVSAHPHRLGKGHAAPVGCDDEPGVCSADPREALRGVAHDPQADDAAPVLAEERHVAQRQRIEDRMVPADVPSIGVDLRIDRLVRATEADVVPRDHPQSRRSEDRDHLAVEIGPGRLSVHEHDQGAVGGPLLDVVDPQAVDLDPVRRERVARESGEALVGRADELHAAGRPVDRHASVDDSALRKDEGLDARPGNRHGCVKTQARRRSNAGRAAGGPRWAGDRRRRPRIASKDRWTHPSVPADDYATDLRGVQSLAGDPPRGPRVERVSDRP